MKDSKNSLLLLVGLIAIAAAIVFHAWWPIYKAERDRDDWDLACARGLASEQKVAMDDAFIFEPRCTEEHCKIFGCRWPY